MPRRPEVFVRPVSTAEGQRLAPVQKTPAHAGDLHPYPGGQHLFAALDLATGKITYRIRDRKRWRESLTFLKQLRRRWPGQRLYLILDNYGPHKRPEVLNWTATTNIELVFTPTNASWLNWIESEFTALPYFALNGTDHRNHAEQDAPSTPTSAGTTNEHNPNTTSQSTHTSDNPITRSTPPDTRVCLMIGVSGGSVSRFQRPASGH